MELRTGSEAGATVAGYADPQLNNKLSFCFKINATLKIADLFQEVIVINYIVTLLILSVRCSWASTNYSNRKKAMFLTVIHGVSSSSTPRY